MPQLQIVSVEEAQGQGRYVPNYVALIQQVPAGQAGKLVLSDEENPITAWKWLVLAAKAMDIPLALGAGDGTSTSGLSPPDPRANHRGTATPITPGAAIHHYG
jgi:hypothetical protein